MAKPFNPECPMKTWTASYAGKVIEVRAPIAMGAQGKAATIFGVDVLDVVVKIKE